MCTRESTSATSYGLFRFFFQAEDGIRDLYVTGVQTCALPISGFIDLHVDVIKDGVNKYKMTNPIFRTSPLEPRYTNFLVFEGISVDEQGKQHYMDAHIAYKNACMNAIEYLQTCGYTAEQAYMILGAAPVEG